jgi:uncharacterized RDD family membrane protein YckC
MTEPIDPNRAMDEPFQFSHLDVKPVHYSAIAPRPLPGISPSGSLPARYIAASIDSLVAIVLAVVIAKQLPDDWLPVQIVTVLYCYLGYYFVTETLWAATPAKWGTGITVRAFDGNRCTAKQILIRTLFRVIEVNPFGTGTIGAICIVMTRDRQRLGDMVAGTIVVPRSRCVD